MKLDKKAFICRWQKGLSKNYNFSKSIEIIANIWYNPHGCARKLRTEEKI
jgi:hypothetical protein